VQDPVLIVLPDRLTIGDAAQLQLTLSDAAARGTLAIDGAQVAEIDTAVLQLLASLWRSPTVCEWRGVSEPLLRSAQLIGLDEMLRFPGGDPGNRGDEPA
jgi:anti-anti-sigma regulatory factor